MNRPTTPAAVIDTFVRCLHTGDLDGAMALYEDDAVFQAAPDAPALRGHEAIRAALGGFFALNGTLEGEIVKTHEAGDVALVANRWTLRGTQPDGTPLDLAGTSADVMRRRADGTWGILVDDPWGAVSGQPA